MHKQTTTLRVTDYSQLRDQIASSGLFEFTDCKVEVWPPLESDTQEIERMVKLIESMVHVTDIKVSGTPEETTRQDYKIVIEETSTPIQRFRKERR
jgi:hypothetical protein